MPEREVNLMEQKFQVRIFKQRLVASSVFNSALDIPFGPSTTRGNFASSSSSDAVGRAAQCALLPPESGFDKASGSTIMLYQVTAFALIGPYSSPNLAPAHLIQCKGVLFDWK